MYCSSPAVTLLTLHYTSRTADQTPKSPGFRPHVDLPVGLVGLVGARPSTNPEGQFSAQQGLTSSSWTLLREFRVLGNPHGGPALTRVGDDDIGLSLLEGECEERQVGRVNVLGITKQLLLACRHVARRQD